jgi:tRNA U34 5-methylaminomethyl-2-thiouridine-forming methyltransferase MnmC
LDVGFGLGLNALSAAALAERVRGGRVDIMSLENDRKAVEAALALARDGAWSGAEALSGIDVAGILERVLDSGRAGGEFFSLEARFVDARAGAAEASGPFDAVFLDPFSPDANPELWTYDFIRLLAGKLSERGVVATYSGAMPVRGAMARAGLIVGSTAPFGRRRSGTIASFDSGRVESPLDAREMAILLESTAGVAYRDPPLAWDRGRIRAFRAKVVAELRRRGVPKWLRRP